VINNKFRATDANVGKAGTLDLFKLYAENTSGSDRSPTELSRVLIKFDINPLRALTGTLLDISHSSFKCTLNLTDVYGGQTTPSNFTLIVFPLSQSFDEGSGTDIVNFSDLDSCNFITASATTTSTNWFHTGANNQGLLGSNNLDIISSGTLGSGVENIWKSQVFSDGTEDLEIDVTSIISGTLSGQIPDHGFRISYSGSQETDTKTRFVKRFSSRHATTVHNRPKLIVTYDDTVIDHHKSFFFNLTGSLFLNNYHRGQHANILSGTAALSVTGSNSIVLRLLSGSYTGSFTGSQHKIGDNFITGVYSASFAISEFETSLRSEIVNAASATFTEIWGSTDSTVGYHTGSLVINTVERTSFNNAPKRLFVNVTNVKSIYKFSEKVRFRVFAEDISRTVKAVKSPIDTPSEIFTKMYYQIRDADSNRVVIPFETKSNGTRLSTDSDGMYFDFYMNSLASGKTYIFDFLISDSGSDQVYTNIPAKFKLEK